MKNVMFALMTALLLSSFLLVGQEIPVIRVPLASGAQVSELEGMLSGQRAFSESVWQQGASSASMTSIGGGTRIPVKTQAYLFHDGANLWVAAVMEEEAPVQSAQRQWEEDFSTDAAFRVALGQGIQGTMQSAIAGYDGAYSKRQNIRHFYEYTVNSAGSISRIYNESPLDTPLFQATAGECAGGWRCIMKIPFASAGVTISDSGVYYFNLTRFYKSLRYGWVLPAYGGYSPMAFGRVEFLKAGEEAKRSRIAQSSKPPYVNAPSGDTYAAPGMTYYPLDRKVTAVFPKAKFTGKVKLAAGKERVEKVVKRGEQVKLEVPVNLASGEKFQAFMECNGGVPFSESYTVPQFPEWHNTDAGAEYVADKVAAPWKALEFKEGELTLAHSRWNFSGNVLPESIEVKGQQLLSAPITIHGVKADGSQVPAGVKRAAVSTRPVFSELTGVSGNGLEVKSRVEFDGFSIIRIRYSGDNSTAWRSLQVRIPLSDGVVQFAHFGYTQQLLNIKSGNYRGNPTELWCGNGNLGITFSYDRNCFRQTNAPRCVIENGVMTIQLADEASGEFQPGYVWEFFLQPTPVRPDIVPPIAHLLSTGRFEGWSDYQGYPDLAHMERVAQDTKNTHAKGSRHYIYFSNLLAENSPGYSEYRSDFLALPPRMWYKRGYDPGKGVPCYVTCLRKHRGDQILDGVRKLVEQADIDGVYLDGPTVPFECENPGHDCSDLLPAGWNESYNAGRVLGQRRFMQRLRGIFDARGKVYPIYGHTGGGFNVATTGICDYYLDGEQMSRYRDGYYVEADKFRINFTGQSLGVRGKLLPILYIDSTFTTRRALPWALVHATETVGLRVEGFHPLEKFFFKFMREKADARFWPYWEEQPHWQLDATRKVYASYLRTDDEGILIVSHLTQAESAECTLNLEKFFPGRKWKVTCVNAPAETWKREGNILKFNVPKGEMMYFYVTALENFPEDMPSRLQKVGNNATVKDFVTQSAITEEKWKFQGGWKLTPEGKVLLQPAKGTFSSVVNKGFLPAEFTARFKVKHANAMQILFDGVVINYKTSTGWLIDGISEFAREAFSATSHNGHRGGYVALNVPVEVVISFRNGLLDVAYDGTRIIHNGLPAVKNGAHTIGFTATGGDAEIQLLELKAGGEDIFPKAETQHPILK